MLLKLYWFSVGGLSLHLISLDVQMYNHEEEKEEVKIVHKTSEVQTKEYEKAAKRLANANLVNLTYSLNSHYSAFLFLWNI